MRSTISITRCRTLQCRSRQIAVRNQRLKGRDGSAVWICRGIRGIQNFDGRFELSHEAKESLYDMLKSETFGKQVVKECKLDEGSQWEFTELLFQPVPWSPMTRKGMPPEFEKYLEDPNYAVINVPPTIMFKAKIFNPSRLCAIFKRTDV